MLPLFDSAAYWDTSTQCFRGGNEMRTMESDTAGEGLEPICVVGRGVVADHVFQTCRKNLFCLYITVYNGHWQTCAPGSMRSYHCPRDYRASCRNVSEPPVFISLWVELPASKRKSDNGCFSVRVSLP